MNTKPIKATVTPDPCNTNAGVVTTNFDEDVSGVDISDFSLTRDGSGVNISNATDGDSQIGVCSKQDGMVHFSLILGLHFSKPEKKQAT